MTTASLTWEPGQDTFDAAIAATIEMDRAAWEAAGAAFTEVDDGDGEHPCLAVGTVESDGETARFGLLDYGDETTHLLVPGTSAERPVLASKIITELLTAGVLTDDAVLEIIGLAKPATVDAKLEYLADVMQQQLAAMHESFLSAAAGAAAGVEATLRESSLSLSQTLRDLVTIHGTVQVGEREEPVEIVGSGSDLNALITSRSTGSGSLRLDTSVTPHSDVDLVLVIETKAGGEPLQMVLDGLSETLPTAELLERLPALRAEAFSLGSVRAPASTHYVVKVPSGGKIAGVVQIRRRLA